jgi:tetratricopeptide (TPR) repeat protein
MFDFGLLTIPLLGAGAVFFVALFSGDNIAIDNIRVMNSLESVSHTEIVLTRALTDELRELNEAALSELPAAAADSNSAEKSLYEFQEYFNLTSLVSSARNLLGFTPYYVSSDFTTRGSVTVFTARIYTRDKIEPVKEVRVKGIPDDLQPILHEAALQILEKIDPYVIALYYYREELAKSEFGFTKTRELIGSSLANSPRWKSYLAYNLIGRMHLTKARLATSLTDEERQVELGTAIDYLKAALVQAPGFFLANRDLASAYADRHQYDLADRYFAKAATIDPNDLTTRQRWAEMLWEQGRVRPAIFQYVAAVELAPENADFRNKLAELYVKANRPDAARIQWQAAHVIDPLHKAFTEKLRSVGAGAP